MTDHQKAKLVLVADDEAVIRIFAAWVSHFGQSEIA